jgi:hypothetical protein
VRTVLELGAGRYSTPAFLDRRAFPEVQRVVSVEQDSYWAEEVRALVGTDPRHELRVIRESTVSALGEIRVSDYDLVLVDDSRTVLERSGTVKRVTEGIGNSTVVVVHDFQERAYQEVVAPGAQTAMVAIHYPVTGVVWSGYAMEADAIARVTSVIRSHAMRVVPQDLEGWVDVFGQVNLMGR